ncbi:MAG: hypothetical protein WBW84_21840 [Acidobacteriaceae bacterium]
MAPLAAFPWAWLLIGLLVGSWIGATIGSAAVLMLAGRRMRQLETVNDLLRAKIRGYTQRSRLATNRGLVPVLRPFRAVTETATLSPGRFASGN